MTKVWECEKDTLEVTEAPEGYSLMIDNLYSGVTPETHEFASIFVLRDERALLIEKLADALGVHVVVGTVEP